LKIIIIKVKKRGEKGRGEGGKRGSG